MKAYTDNKTIYIKDFIKQKHKKEGSINLQSMTKAVE